jgi:RNA polymerase sigma-70 factor (ECF subfamily)
MALTAEQLVADVLRGNHAAFAELIRRYERSVVGVCASILGEYDAARDACQESFVVAYERLGQLRDPAAFGGWILQIARRTAIGYARRRRRERATDQEHLEQFEQRNGCSNAELLDVLDSINRLPIHERDAVLLHYFDFQSVDDVARATDRSVGTVTKQLTRARQRLRQWFEQEAIR